MMQTRINREIRQYTESVFMGLSLRQLLCSCAAMGCATVCFFLLRGRLGTEALSWICILSAVPFAVLGFVSYNGMTAEQLIMAVVMTEIICPKRLSASADSYYMEIFGPKGKERRRCGNRCSGKRRIW